MRLNVTQTALLRDAARNRHGVVAIHTGFYIGRRASAYGARKHGACVALREAGLFEFVSRSSGVHHFVGGFASEHFTESVWRITDAGRVALA